MADLDWLISVPCTGTPYIEKFLNGPYQSILEALKRISGHWRLVIHTSQASSFYSAISPIQDRVFFLPYPADNNLYGALGKAHRDVLNLAQIGEKLALLCADLTVSVEVFEAAERRFKEGKK